VTVTAVEKSAVVVRGAAGFREIVIHLVFLSMEGKDARDYPIWLCGSEVV